MNYYYHFDICAYVLLLVILFSIYFRKLQYGKVNRVFTIFAWLLSFCILFDILSVIPLGSLSLKKQTMVKTLACYGYYILHSCLLPFFTIFIGICSGTWDKFINKYPIRSHLFKLPFYINIMLILTNPWTGGVFTIVNGAFNRGSLTFFVYLIPMFYMAYSFIYLLTHGSALTDEKRQVLEMVYPLNLIAVYIQFINSNILMEMFSMAITMLIIMMFVLKPEESMESDIESKSYIAFVEEQTKLFASGRTSLVILLKIVEDNEITILYNEKFHRQLLKKVVRTVRKNVDAKDRKIVGIYYLYHGHFAIILDKRSTKDVIKRKTQIIYDALVKDTQLPNSTMDVNFEMCNIRIPVDIDNVEQFRLFSEAFFNKENSKPYTQYWELTNEEKEHLLFDINKEVENALKNNRFEMYYQPIYYTKDGKFHSAEALIRLHGEEDSFISPSVFIPASEKSGAIYSIGEFVNNDVFSFIKDNNINDLGLDCIEINLSIIQCMEENFDVKLISKMKKYGIDPDMVNFEITETASDYISDAVRKNLLKLNDKNIQFSLDDYGTGYSNLIRVTSFPFKIIKLDKSLTDRIAEHRMHSVIKDTINLLKNVGAMIVVEGVEDKETADWFIAEGVDFIQGYYFAKPMPKDEFLKFIRNNN